MKYYRKISTGENILIDEETSMNIVLVHIGGADAFVYRETANAIKGIAIHNTLKANNPSDFSEISSGEWDSIKANVLSSLNSHQAPANIFYKRPKDGFIYCWDEQALKASVFTNPELGTSAFMAFKETYAKNEIELRKKEVSTYEEITEADWTSRKSQILSILNSL